MKLRRLTISNCSRIKDIDVAVRDNMVLIGPNGSGKTTVLQCLEMLLGMDDQRLYEAASNGFVRDTSLPFSVQVAFGALNAEERAAFSNEVEVGGASELVVRLEVTAGDVGVGDGDRRESCGESGMGDAPSNGDASGIGDAHGGSGNGDAPGNGMGDAPGKGDAPGNGDAPGKGVRISWSFPNRGIPRAPSRAQRGAFGWMLLKTRASLQGQDANILAIDEPEAHLHPSSQRSLAKMLKASGSQKILVTHSPTIAGSFEPDEIVVIRSDGSAVQPEEGFLSGDAGMLARWWIGSQLEPLTAGVVIAVEGPSDRIIVNRVASSLGLDLDQHDVVVVETSGSGDMKVVESIFGKAGFDIPLFELIDADAQDVAAKRRGVGPDELEAHRVFVSLADLEDEYVQAIGARRLWDKMRFAKTFSRNVLGQCDVEPDGYPTEANLAEFIRGKSNRKIPSSLLAASLIDDANAHDVKSVAKLLAAALS